MADEQWQPPTGRMHNGGIIFSDWRPIRDAIEAAYRALGREPPGNIPVDEWNLAALAISAYEFELRPRCATCQKKLMVHETIRCLDCKAALCVNCAPGHFGRRQ